MKRHSVILLFAWVILLFACQAAAAEDATSQDEEIRMLREQLRSGNAADRVSAARSLQRIKTDAAFKALLEGLGDRDEDVQRTVISAVAYFKKPEAAEALNRIFKDCSVTTKLYIIRQLGDYQDMGEVSLFLRALDDKNDSVRMDALKQLNRRRDYPGVVDVFLRIMDTDDERLRGEVVGYVPLKTEDPKEMKIMSKGLKDEHHTVQMRALDRLKTMELDPDVKLELALTAKSKLSSVQDKVVDVLKEIGTDKAVDALLRILRAEKNNMSCQKICAALGAIGGESAARGLSEYIYHKELIIRTAAIQALGNIQNEISKTALKKALRDSDTGVQKIAIQGLAKFKSADLIGDIVKAVNSKSPLDMHVEVIKALEMIEDPKAIAAIIKIAEGADLAVSAEAIKVLGKMRRPEAVAPITLQIKKNISGDGNEVRSFLRFAMDALLEIGGPEIEEAMITMANSNIMDVRTDALKRLGKFSSDGATRALLRALSDQEKTVRLAALKAVKQSLPPQTVESVVRLVSDRNKDVQLAAIEALEAYALPKTAYSLVRDYDDDRCYKAAVRALSVIDSKDGRDFLLKALSHRDPKVRLDALTGLGLPWVRGDNAAGKKLVEFLAQEQDRRLRDAAINALGTNGTEGAVNKLEELCNSEVLPDAEAATVAIGRTGSDRAADILLKLLETARYSVKINAITALGDIGDEKAVQPLIMLLDDQDVIIRATSVEALGKFNTEDAKKGLLKALADKSTRVTNPAIRVLVKYRGDADVRQAVIKLMESKVPRVRKETAELLPPYASHDFVPTLIAHMRDDADKDVRAACLQSLRRMLNRDLGEKADDWLNWWTAEREKSVAELVNAGFIDKGYKLADASKRNLVEEYIRALGDENDCIRYNAISRLREITGRNFRYDPAAKDNSAPIRAWNEWWKANRDRFN